MNRNNSSCWKKASEEMVSGYNDALSKKKHVLDAEINTKTSNISAAILSLQKRIGLYNK